MAARAALTQAQAFSMIVVEAYGAPLLIDDAAGVGLAATLPRRFPPGMVAERSKATALPRYATARDPQRGEYLLACCGETVERSRSGEGLIDHLCARLELDMAVLARGYVFIHAGVVAWRGVAILIPGMSGSGKSTLVAELVRRGAQYYSDEWAVLDECGRVHPFPRPIAIRNGAPLLTHVPARPPRELPPLPVALAVASTYQPGCTWNPAILRGARALLPIVDNAVLVRERPAHVLRVAAALGSSLVTLESPRPEAEAVALDILDFVDVVQAGQLDRFSSVRRPGAARNDPRATTAGHRSPAHGNLRKAPYLRIENLLTEDEHRRLLAFARAHENEFRDSTVHDEAGSRRLAPDVRRSRTLYALEEDWSPVFDRLPALLPHVRRELGVPWFRLGAIERQIHAHRSGDFFDRHVDNAHGDVAARRISAVYYFHELPRRFDGGALYLYDEIDCGARRHIGPSCTALEPLDNSIVFFPSGSTHGVEPVRERDGDFGASRFTVTFWFREDEEPQPASEPAIIA